MEWIEKIKVTIADVQLDLKLLIELELTENPILVQQNRNNDRPAVKPKK